MAGTAGERDNFSGDVPLTVPTGGVTKGKIYLINDAYFVARETASAAATANFGALVGNKAIRVTKATGTGKSFAVGDKVYVLSNQAVPATATGAVLLPCIAVEVAATTDAAVLVMPGGIAPTAT